MSRISNPIECPQCKKTLRQNHIDDVRVFNDEVTLVVGCSKCNSSWVFEGIINFQRAWTIKEVDYGDGITAEEEIEYKL